MPPSSSFAELSIRWTHRSRYEMGLRLAATFRGKRLLDYGCGDGTFLAMLCSGRDRPAEAVAQRFTVPGDGLCHTVSARAESGLRARRAPRCPARTVDAVFCMEVLEHVVELDSVIDRLWRALNPGGALVVSVPVETGLPLLVKQAARGLPDGAGLATTLTPSSYTIAEYWSGLTAGRRQHMSRPVYGGDVAPYHGSQGLQLAVAA